MKPKAKELLDEVRSQLTRLGEPAGMESARRFFKPDERIQGYGVAAPELQQLSRAVYHKIKSWPIAERTALSTALWQSGAHEEGAIFCYVWRRWGKQFDAADFRLFTRWLDRYVHNWAHCDGLSLWLLGAAVANHSELAKELIAWTESPNRWKRRAAAVSLVPSARAGNLTAEILSVATPLLPDSDQMVQKGVGWLLKETYPRQSVKLMRFLFPRRSSTSRLVLRYAAEKMSPQDRSRLLAIDPR